MEEIKKDKEEADKKAAKVAEKKAARAPDREKLLTLADRIDLLALPTCKDSEAVKIAADAKILLGKISKHIRDSAKKMDQE